jgi:Na+-driven multidrug efflux pump
MLSYGVILRSLGYTKDIFNSNLLAFISAIPLTYFLVKNFGLTGAAVSAVTVYFVNAISQLFLSVKRLDKRLSEVLPVGELLKLAAIGAVLFLGLFRVQDVVPSRIMRIIFSTGVFSLAYVYACYKFRVFNVFQEEFVRKVWHRLKLIGKSNDRPNAGG